MLSPKNWEPFFSNEEIKNFKVRKEIKFLNFDDKYFNGFYKNKYLSKFKNWFIPLINNFLDEYYHGFYCQKIDLSFFKKHAISITNIFYKRLFVLIFDNKKLISNKKMKNIIFKILYFYDRSPLFFNEEYINNLAWWNSNEKKFENNDEIIFKNNPNKKIVLSKLFISILKKHKINIIPSISIENSSYSYKNEIKRQFSILGGLALSSSNNSILSQQSCCDVKNFPFSFFSFFLCFFSASNKFFLWKNSRAYVRTVLFAENTARACCHGDGVRKMSQVSNRYSFFNPAI